MTKILGALVLIAIGFGVYFFMRSNQQPDQSTDFFDQNQNSNPAPQPTPPPTPTPPAAVEPAPDKAVATIETNKGTFKVTLDGKAAPKTVANFIKLAKEDFYVNTKFHRIIASFMIQGGDPNSKDNDPENDGQGGPGYTVPAEIGLKHTAGAIAMARTPDQVNPAKASSGSQFYITLEPQSGLDGQYTVFGYVTSGMDVVEKIGLTPTDFNPYTGEPSPSLPLEDVIIKKVTIQ